MAILSSNPTELESSVDVWGHRALGLELFSFALGRITAYLIFTGQGPHPVLGALFVFALISGFAAAICGIVGVCRDSSKWPSILAIVLFPLTVIYTV